MRKQNNYESPAGLILDVYFYLIFGIFDELQDHAIVYSLSLRG